MKKWFSIFIFVSSGLFLLGFIVWEILRFDMIFSGCLKIAIIVTFSMLCVFIGMLVLPEENGK